MLEIPDFEQIYSSLTAKGIFKFGHDSIRIMRCMAYYDHYFEIINYFDLIAYLLKDSQEIS